MSKRSSRTTRVSFAILRDLPIAGKLALLVLVPLGVILAATLALTVIGLNRLETGTSAERLQQNVQAISQQFVELEANLILNINQLTADPILLEAVQRGDQTTLQGILLSRSIQSNFNHMQIVDAAGRTMAAKQSFELGTTPPELERLHDLGLLQIEASGLVPTAQGWLLTVARPLKTQAGAVVGTLSIGYLLNAPALFRLNFERANPRLALFDAQGNVNALGAADAPGNLEDIFDVDRDLWAQARSGQIVFDQASSYGEAQRVAYAPLMIRNQPAAVFSLALSTAATTSLRDQLVIINLVAAGVLALLATLGVVGLARNFIVRPITALVAGAEKITAGQMELVTFDVINHDEIGTLANAFNSMTSQLQQTLSNLENHTRRLEIIASLSENLSRILNVEELLTKMVNQIKDSFGYYHAHVYLRDYNGENLVVAAGTGEAGAEMKTKGHRIRLDAPTSLVARAARSGEIVRVDDVREAEDWLPNPLLPHTRSEMAVPIILEEQVVGVLDVQEDKVASLIEGDASLLRTLANQIAIALHNARMFTEVETALKEARALQRRYLVEAWDKSRVTRKNVGRIQFSLGESTTLSETIMAGAQQHALNHKNPSLVILKDQPDGPDSHHALVAPIMLRNIAIGNVQLHNIDPDRLWSEGELALINAVIDQVAQAAETLRLLDETQERATREELVSQISNKIRRAPDMESLVKVAMSELSRVLNPARTFVHLNLLEARPSGEVKAGENGKNGNSEQHPEADSTISITHLTSEI